MDSFFTYEALTPTAVIAGLIFIIYTFIINTVKLRKAKIDQNIAEQEQKKAEIEKDIAEQEKESVIEIASIKKEAQSKLMLQAEDIAADISTKLIEDTSWLERFMDETGVMYSGSVYGKRINHFAYEKKLLAIEAIQIIESYLDEYPHKKYCLIIDSGTSMYQIFMELSKKLIDKEALKVNKKWSKRVSIITNNLPGVQYLMKHCKLDPNNDYSEMAIKCFLLPGKPLSIYAAVTSQETVTWLDRIRENVLPKEMGWGEDDDYDIIGFVTGNYICRETINNRIRYLPVARGEGHFEVKSKIVEVSNKIILMSPLMKFSHANVHVLNHINNFTIDRDDPDANSKPAEVKYVRILINDIENCVYLTTSRQRHNYFHSFGESLKFELEQLYRKEQLHDFENNILMQPFNIQERIIDSKNQLDKELAKEIPHDNLREKFISNKEKYSYFIWSAASANQIESDNEAEITALRKIAEDKEAQKRP